MNRIKFPTYSIFKYNKLKLRKVKWSICFEIFKLSIVSCRDGCQALGNGMYKQHMAAFRKQKGSGTAVPGTASGPIVMCVWYFSKALFCV